MSGGVNLRRQEVEEKREWMVEYFKCREKGHKYKECLE